MNKKLLAVAIATAMAAPFAMADEGSVTISGNVGAGLSSVKFNNDTTASDIDPGGSDLLISGWESLGNGLKAVFVVKTWLNVTGNAGGGSADELLLGNAKDAYVGLAGNFGTVAFGIHGSPYKISTVGLDLFGDTIGDHRVAGVTNAQGTLHGAISDAVIWFLPNMSGISGQLQYGTEDNLDGNPTPWGAMFNYSNGPLYVTYAHADDDAVLNEKGNKVGAGYSFGDTKIIAVAERTKVEGAEAINAYSLGLSQTFGANTAKIQYARNNLDPEDQSLWAVGLDHSLSKRTVVYAMYADGDELVGITSGLDSGFEVGIGHSF